MGRPYDEGTVIKLAYAYEQATHHRKPPTTTPPLPGEP
jgi:amidase